MRRTAFILLAVLAVLAAGCTMPYVQSMDGTATAIIRQVTEISGTLQTTPTPAATGTPSPTSIFDPFPTFTATPPIYPTYQHLTPSPRPSYYILQQGEFPYCIARRFDVNPRELLSLNGLPSGMVYSPGLVLTIPQTGTPFPPPRWLQLHPVQNYTVMQQTTVYKLACLFGDVDPVVLMQVNGLTSPILNLGQIIQIP
jgi:LysM repeat protein